MKIGAYLLKLFIEEFPDTHCYGCKIIKFIVGNYTECDLFTQSDHCGDLVPTMQSRSKHQSCYFRSAKTVLFTFHTQSTTNELPWAKFVRSASSVECKQHILSSRSPQTSLWALSEEVGYRHYSTGSIIIYLKPAEK